MKCFKVVCEIGKGISHESQAGLARFLLGLIMTFGIVACGENLNGQLLESANDGDLARVKVLLNKGADPNVANIFGWPVLMLAAKRGNTEIVKLLLDKGAQVNAGNSWERTPSPKPREDAIWKWRNF